MDARKGGVGVVEREGFEKCHSHTHSRRSLLLFLKVQEFKEIKRIGSRTSRIGEGSIGRALQLADTGGLALYEEMVQQLAGLPRPEVARLHGALDAIARTRSAAGAFEAYDVFCDLLTTWIMRQVSARARGQAALEIMPGEGEVAARLADRASL